MLVDASISKEYLGCICNLFKEKDVNRNLFQISGGGTFFYQVLGMFSKKTYIEELEFLQSIPNTIRDHEPYIFLSLAEYQNESMIPNPSYFILNFKDKNYVAKLLQASSKTREEQFVINGNFYASALFADKLPLYPLLNDYEEFLCLVIIKKSKLEYFKSLAYNLPFKSIIFIEDEEKNLEENINNIKRAFETFIEKTKIIKRLDILFNELDSINYIK